MTNSTASILSGAAIVGVVTTSVLCGKATLKADEILAEKNGQSQKEKIKAVLPIYIPTLIAGGLTIVAILSSDIIKNNNYNSLLGAYALTTNSFNTYKRTVSKIIDEDQLKQVEKESDQAFIERNKNVVEKTGYGDTLFIEELTGRQFYSSLEVVYEAQKMIQDRILLGGPSKLNLLHGGYGIRKSDIGKKLLWDPYTMEVDYGSTNIGFINKKMFVNGKVCYLITYLIPPNVELDD